MEKIERNSKDQNCTDDNLLPIRVNAVQIQTITKHTHMPTAILAAYDDIAVGAMRALYEYKYRVPEDISIIGYDNIRQSAFLRCPLTTISPPVEKMAKICLDILFQKIEDKNLKTIQHISLNSELIIRESTTKINLGE